LELPDELATWELVSAMTLADPAYGEVGEFRLGLEQRQPAYVVQVPGTISAYVEDVMPETVPYTDQGRPPVPRYRQRRSWPAPGWPSGIGIPVLSEPAGGGRWRSTARRSAAPDATATRSTC
jgi:DDE superfamily endonuclease